MKKISLNVLIFLFVSLLKLDLYSQKVILVTKDNFSALGWQKGQSNTDASGAPSIRALATDFVYITCPLKLKNSIPKLRLGSVYMTYPKNTPDPDLPNPKNDPTLFRVLLLNNSYFDTKLSDITELRYSTYTVSTPFNTPDASGFTAHPRVAPILLLQIDMDGDGQNINNINFEPSSQPIKLTPGGTPILPVDLDTWQEWDALHGNNRWFFFQRPNTRKETLPEFFSFDFFRTKYPNAKIVNSNFLMAQNQGPGIRFIVGANPKNYYDDFRGYVDAFRIATPLKREVSRGNPGGDILYDFGGECLNVVDVPFVVKPPWPIYRLPFIIFSLIALALIGYFIYRKTRSTNK